MPQSTYLTPQTSGTAITKKHDQMEVPDDPIALFIGGGRTGANIGGDPPRQMEGATELKTSQFADAIIGNM